MIRRMRRLVGSVIAVVSVMAMLAVPSVALAANHSGSHGKPGHTEPSNAQLVRSSGTSGASGTISANAALDVNPWGCYSQSNNPHLSGHNPGYVSAIGTTTCSVAPPDNYTDGALYRQDCFLIFCKWTEVGSDEQDLSFVTSTRAIPNHQCSDASSHLYELDTYSEVDDGVNFYSAITYKQATVNCG